MNKKLAKIEYLPNNFKVLEEGDHVICAISGKIISGMIANENTNLDLKPYSSLRFS